MSHFIDDGFTLDYSVDGRVGLYAPFAIKYRPALPERVLEWRLESSARPGEEPRVTARRQMDNDARLITEHVLAWTLPPYGMPHPSDELMKADGRTVPTIERVKRLHEPIIRELVEVVAGYAFRRVELEKN